jgi:hypothetical protein
MNNVSLSSEFDDEDVINFVVNLDRTRKDHFHYWDDQEFYNRYRIFKESVIMLLEQIDGNIRNATNW